MALNPLGGAGGQQRSPGMTRLQMSQMELELTSDMFNRMSDLCYQKCVDDGGRKYTKGKLDVKEMACTDRCVGKYLAATIRVGEKLQQYQEQLQAQKQMQQSFG